MPRISSMHAGAANMSYGANSMMVQVGNKLQGLPPTTNKPTQLISHIRTKADGDKRDYIFCINQLAGGVGRHAGQFTPGADGVKECTTGKYDTDQNTCEYINMEALSDWVANQYSSILATSKQPSIIDNDTRAKNYVRLAMVSKADLDNYNMYIAVAGGSGGKTIISYIHSIEHLHDAQNNYPTNLSGVLHPNVDITPFMDYASGGPQPPTTISNLSGDITLWQPPSQFTAILAAVQNSLNNNIAAKKTLETLHNKNLFISGHSGQYALVAVMFPEEFIGSSVFSSMNTWLGAAVTAGDRSAPKIWNLYFLSSQGTRNGFTNFVNTRNVTNSMYYGQVTTSCDVSPTAIPVASRHFTSGLPHQANTFPATSAMLPFVNFLIG